MFNHSTPIPTDEDLSYVHPTPVKLLHPSLSVDKMYHLVMKEKLWTSWSSDSFGIKYANNNINNNNNNKNDDDIDGESTSKPFEVDIKGNVATLRDRMLIRDSQSEQVIGVILAMHLKAETTFKIYGFTPFRDDVIQAPSENQKYDGKDLYEWAECKDKFFSVRKTMKTYDGVKYVMDGVGKVIAAHRQMRITRDDKPCCHCVEKTMGIFTGNQWDIKIAPGIDPVLIVAFMAIMDEMNENK